MRPLYFPSFVKILTGMMALRCLLLAPAALSQQAPEIVAPLTGTDSGERNSTVDPGAANSTVVYPGSLISTIPSLPATCWTEYPASMFSAGIAVRGRGLGTGGNILINGQRIAGKDNSARDQLDRITAAEVERIEIIRDTSGELNVRGAGEVINIILWRCLTVDVQVELVQRLNHDDTYEIGGSIGWSMQIANFQALVNAESRPNHEKP